MPTAYKDNEEKSSRIITSLWYSLLLKVILFLVLQFEKLQKKVEWQKKSSNEYTG